MIIWLLMAIISLATVIFAFKMRSLVSYRLWNIAWIALIIMSLGMFIRRLLVLIGHFHSVYFITDWFIPLNMWLSNVGLLVLLILLWKIFRKYL